MSSWKERSLAQARCRTRYGAQENPGADAPDAAGEAGAAYQDGGEDGQQQIRIDGTQIDENTWTHTAIMPMNSEIEASAAASSTTARNMTASPGWNEERTLFLFCSRKSRAI